LLAKKKSLVRSTPAVLKGQLYSMEKNKKGQGRVCHARGRVCETEIIENPASEMKEGKNKTKRS